MTKMNPVTPTLMAFLKVGIHERPARMESLIFISALTDGRLGSHELSYPPLLEAGDIQGASDWLWDIHWGFDENRQFIVPFYEGQAPQGS